MKTKVGTIDMTPTWEAILPALIVAVENGTALGRKIATEELRRMAKLADMYAADVKAKDMPCDTKN
ncbi:hypothetical protein PHIN3_345 [Sinorhizobium phage phiN3]|uniref:Uncharacterized protein n=1 Tax=Sinorhizobium phage phiN3 TaxID=1647405 RepID=A0A0F6SJ54_9CAUD|nr:hypothetical protein AVT40_gp188 [Sinorhizobium phage phiN3]AKF13608.1 hypothetical protein PHIN3_345 [Sinorhizobium phage phiN3]